MHDYVGTLLRRARARAALSQRELARRAGTAQSVVARIERGQTSPTWATLQRLLAAAGCELRAAVGERTTVSDAAHERVTDSVTQAYLRDVDRTLLRENLRKSVSERVASLAALQRLAAEARGAAKRSGRRS